MELQNAKCARYKREIISMTRLLGMQLPAAALAFFMVVAATMVGCAPPDEQGKSLADTSTKTTSLADRKDLIKIPVNISAHRAGLSLKVAATDWEIDVAGCATNYVQDGVTMSDVGGSINFYTGDHGCVAKLMSFEMSGATFVPDVDFDEYAEGEVATFEKVGATATKLKVIIISQVDNDIDSSDAISYEFSAYVNGADKTIDMVDYSEAIDVSVAGQDVPTFTLDTFDLVSIDATDGFGTFDITMDCTPDLVAGASADLATCAGMNFGENVKMKELQTMFLQDTALTDYTDIDGSRTELLAMDWDADGRTVLAGDVTVGTSKVKVRHVSADQLHDNVDYVMIVRAKDPDDADAPQAFLWWHVHFTPLTP